MRVLFDRTWGARASVVLMSTILLGGCGVVHASQVAADNSAPIPTPTRQCTPPAPVIAAYVAMPSSPDSMGTYSMAVAAAEMDASMERARLASAYSTCMAGGT